ncbi:MAG: hypothetical protein M5U18_00040 [Dehalococcoidia bacterium]|nr:hypothetical protein [Dehalococcoidia bacterium]
MGAGVREPGRDAAEGAATRGRRGLVVQAQHGNERDDREPGDEGRGVDGPGREELVHDARDRQGQRHGHLAGDREERDRGGNIFPPRGSRHAGTARRRIDGLDARGQEGDYGDKADASFAEWFRQHQHGDPGVGHERQRLAGEQHALAVGTVSYGAAQEAERDHAGASAGREDARIDDRGVGEVLAYPEDLGHQMQGEEDANDSRPGEEQAKVPARKGAKRRPGCQAVGHPTIIAERLHALYHTHDRSGILLRP